MEKNKNKILELEKEIFKKNNKLLERQNELDKNQEEIIKYQSEINTLRIELKIKNDELSRLNSDLINQNKKIEEYKVLITEEKNKNKKLEEQNNNMITTNINYINNKFKVNTIDASRTNSANKTIYKNKNKFLIKADKSSSESENTKISNNTKEILKTDYNTNINSEIKDQQELDLTPENYVIVKCTELSLIRLL